MSHTFQMRWDNVDSAIGPYSYNCSCVANSFPIYWPSPSIITVLCVRSFILMPFIHIMRLCNIFGARYHIGWTFVHFYSDGLPTSSFPIRSMIMSLCPSSHILVLPHSSQTWRLLEAGIFICQTYGVTMSWIKYNHVIKVVQRRTRSKPWL